MLELSNLESEGLQLIKCPICQEMKDEGAGLGCKHVFCRICLEMYLNNKIDDGIVMIIKCPSCEYQLSYDEVTINIGEPKREKYAKFRTLQFADRDPTVRHCPNKLCELYVQLNSNHCACGQEICINCGNEYHGLSSCQDLLDQIFVLDSRQEKIQRCPSCKVVVQKEGGCNHMTCKRCQYQFCWICRRKYTGKFHFNVAKHYNNFNYLFGCPNKQYTNTTPWKYPKLQQYLPFVMLVLFSPLWISIGLILFVLHPFCGGYYLFHKWDESAIRHLSTIQKWLVAVFIYVIAGIVLYPFVVLYECLYILSFLIYCVVRLIKKIKDKF